MEDPLIESIIASDALHARWLNTLSYLENCGARKIAACEHPTLVPREMLKHAYEEFKHAYYLKQQIRKLNTPFLETYSQQEMLGGLASLRYLDKLELEICRLLKNTSHTENFEIKSEAYIWTTYAIEARASHVYPKYQEWLIKMRSPVSVKSILLEESQHLEEMRSFCRKRLKHEEIEKEITVLEATLYKRLLSSFLQMI
jgi:hypothetical protein